MSPETREAVGFVGLAGAPNAGKSTLVNRLVGQKVSIVSRRPQTTRERVCGIHTDERMQLVLVDIPGILEADDPFNLALHDCAQTSLNGCDVVLHLCDARHPEQPEDRPVRAIIRRCGRPVWLVWNKMDRLKQGRPLPTPSELTYHRAFELSARTGQGIEPLLEALAQALPAGPLLYEADQVCDRNLRFLAAELVREQLFRHMGQEIPYGATTVTETFDEKPGEKIFVRIVIVTERASHKPIIIGQGGRTLKKIGQQARTQIEQLSGQPVFLELFVKVRPKWRSRPALLSEYGLTRSVSG